MANPAFRDHFSASAGDYARFRPTYPAELFDWVAAQAPSRERVWDVATGSGQAATGLARHFSLVVASDASHMQLASAAAHPRVRYLRSRAEASGLAARSMDAVVVAQAVHWFDRPAFFEEAARVARPGALVAVWTYGNPEISPEVDAVVAPFYRDVIGPYWPAERRLIEEMYRSITLPFATVGVPALALEMPMPLDGLLGYIGTWSGVQRYRAVVGADPLPALRASLAGVWGDAASTKMTRWPMAIRAGRAA